MKPILRKINPALDYSFSIREDMGPYLYNHWHYHPEIELTLIRKGKGMRLVGDSVEPFSDGDLVILGGNLPHYWRSDPLYFEALPNLGIEAVAIHFKEDFWGKQLLDLPEFKQIKELLLLSRRGIHIYGHTHKIVSAMMENILNAKGTERITMLISILQVIASSKEYDTLSGIGFAKSYELNQTDNINAIYNYTFDHFQNKITIEEVAAIANVSPHSFCRYFKTRTLKTYWQFLLEVRIGYACKLIIENDMSISQICYSCGFNNLSNFNRQFKSITQMTPSQYMKVHLRIPALT